MKNRSHGIKKGPDEVAFSIISYLLVAVFAVCCFLPFYLILVGSFTDEKWILQKGYTFFLTGENFSLGGYKTVFETPETILSAYGVTVFVTVVGTLLSVLITTMAGYVISRKSFPWRNGFAFFFFFTTLFSGGLIPWYLMCTKVLAFKNHIYALIIPGLFSVWNMIISKNFMKSVPDELEESAKIDGASPFQIYTKIMVPVSKPLIATLCLFTALGYWNDWYNCMLFISDSRLYNLQFTLQNILTSIEKISEIASKSGIQMAALPSEGLKMAMTVVTVGPIILLYPFLQKYFVKGLTIGAVKG